MEDEILRLSLISTKVANRTVKLHLVVIAALLQSRYQLNCIVSSSSVTDLNEFSRRLFLTQYKFSLHQSKLICIRCRFRLFKNFRRDD